MSPRQPSVLLLSLPRSGSSWVGEVLGHAPDALYLREPVTQGEPAIHQLGTVISPDDPEIQASYRRLADKAFLGIPDFPKNIACYPEQWGLGDRIMRRLVVKEVNPRACQWYIDRYRPRILFLLRHPAAIALSYLKSEWIGPTPEDWFACGEKLASDLLYAAQALETYDDYSTVFFETLCEDPDEAFRDLVKFADLDWSNRIQAYIDERREYTSQIVGAWQNQVSRDALEALICGYLKLGLPWNENVPAAWALTVGGDGRAGRR